MKPTKEELAVREYALDERMQWIVDMWFKNFPTAEDRLHRIKTNKYRDESRKHADEQVLCLFRGQLCAFNTMLWREGCTINDQCDWEEKGVLSVRGWDIPE